MADDIVIRAEGLGKKYVIGHEAQRERYVALRDVIARGARNVWRMAADMAKGRVVVPGDTVEEFWALKDVSFEVKRGEVLGIIGRNGAGKSTLLKILSRITEPTEGRVTIKGRVASLLEVGTGFHPELTGRENIYLNGAILGMTRAEIKRKFDEIVAFAEVEKFLDTPVKRYSSGMYVRLAFAVAAHLEPEILIVDEVLSVGDAAFQKKSLGKMQDVAGRGRTVLFVSHHMLAVQKLCEKALLLERGECRAIGSAREIIQDYILEAAEAHYTASPDSENRTRIVSARVLNESPYTDEEIQIEIRWFLHRKFRDIGIGIIFNSGDGQRIFDSTPSDQNLSSPGSEGFHTAVYRVAPNTFLAQTYTVSISLWSDGQFLDYPSPALRFSVEPGPVGPYSNFSRREGLVQARGKWQIAGSKYAGSGDGTCTAIFGADG